MINQFTDNYRFLSNFFEYPIIWRRRSWRTVEHAYQAEKFMDTQWQEKIFHCRTPHLAKRYGKVSVPRIKRNWKLLRDSVMWELIRIKFSVDNAHGHLLCLTYPQTLIEGNIWGDTYWGQVDGIGENTLGRMLMKRRGELMLLNAFDLEFDVTNHKTISLYEC